MDQFFDIGWPALRFEALDQPVVAGGGQLADEEATVLASQVEAYLAGGCAMT